MINKSAGRIISTYLMGVPMEIHVGVTFAQGLPWVVIITHLQGVELGSVSLPLHAWEEVDAAIDVCLREGGFIVDKQGK